MNKALRLAILFAVYVLLNSCRNDKIDFSTLNSGSTGYPDNVNAIFQSKCSITGCHTIQDKDGAGGLDLSSWDALFNGARNGSAVVPYSAKYSFLTYFINSYPDLGVIHDSIGNVMPPNPPVLSHDEVSTVIDWINSGALSKAGSEKFPSVASRNKIYVAMQSKDVVAVFDAASRQIMRYISVGADSTQNEQPHQIRISPDGQYWYVIFRNGTVMQRYRTLDDGLDATINIGPGNWNTVAITPDGHHAFVVDFNPFALGGKVVHVNLQTNTMTSASITLDSPHGCYFMHTQNVLYVTAQYGNFIYKFDFSADPTYAFIDNPNVVVMRTGAAPSITSSLDAHEIIFTPDESRYFVTCQKSNGVRIFNTANDSLLDSIPVGSFPQEMAISPSHHLLFVTCQEDSVSSSLQPGEKGSVFVYDYANNQPVNINLGNSAGFTRVYQPHGIAVDEASGKVFVASLNYSTSGPAPHHSTGGNERNGFISIIDMSTMEYLSFMDGFGFPYMYKSEVLPFPYSAMAK